MTQTEENRQYLTTIPEAAEILGLTQRRIRQFVEEGNVPRPVRGQIDLAWATYFTTGASITERWYKKPRDPKTLVSLAWLAGVEAPSPEDISAFSHLFERNGFDRDTALMALGTARALMGGR